MKYGQEYVHYKLLCFKKMYIIVLDISDNEISGNESERSNSSHDNDGAHESTEDEPDSDDSSEMDENECESRRNALLQHVQDLEGQFSHLREQLYRERISQVHAGH